VSANARLSFECAALEELRVARKCGRAAEAHTSTRRC
jgi:hypothetical protein